MIFLKICQIKNFDTDSVFSSFVLKRGTSSEKAVVLLLKRQCFL